MYIYSSLYYNCSIIRGRRTAARQVDQSPTRSPAQTLSSFLFILSSRQHRVIIASIHYGMFPNGWSKDRKDKRAMQQPLLYNSKSLYDGPRRGQKQQQLKGSIIELSTLPFNNIFRIPYFGVI